MLGAIALLSLALLAVSAHRALPIALAIGAGVGAWTFTTSISAALIAGTSALLMAATALDLAVLQARARRFVIVVETMAASSLALIGGYAIFVSSGLTGSALTLAIVGVAMIGACNSLRFRLAL